MGSHRKPRSARRLAGGLVVLAFLFAATAPASARTGEAWSPPAVALQLVDWVQDFLSRVGFADLAPEPASPRADGPEKVFGREGKCVDPSGATIPCPEDSSTDGSSWEVPAPSGGVLPG